MDLSKFNLIHTRQEAPALSDTPHIMVWKTCLRTIYFGFEQPTVQGLSDVEIYSGKEAYQFLLQVVCGLKSPMVGETEVFGQFKNFIEGINGQEAVDLYIKNILIDIRNTAKRIRSQYLINLGAQSYGSLLRKSIDFNKEIHIIGAGQFVEEIVPWLSKTSKNISIHCRNTIKASQTKVFTDLNIVNIKQKERFTGTLIIAAPLSSQRIKELMDGQSLDVIFDLRGESNTDPLNTEIKVISLNNFFNKIQNNKSKISDRVSRANSEILTHINMRLKEQKLNPFGWDDICA